MTYVLLLADPLDPNGGARAISLQQQVFRTSPGGEDLTVSFRPNRTDDLLASAKASDDLAYRILYREGILRSQVVVRYQLGEAPTNVVGRSADLLFALALIAHLYEDSAHGRSLAGSSSTVAATGTLNLDGSVGSVEHVEAKLRAAVAFFNGRVGTAFFPADNSTEVNVRALSEKHPNVKLVPVGHLDEALEHLGITLERVYLRNPFRGLEYFDYEHRAIFFGRDAEIRAVVEQLIRREANGVPGVLVEGASGSGKSSFMRAGLLPALVNSASQAVDVAETLRRRPVRDSVRRAIWRVGLLSNTADETKIAQSILECWRDLPEFHATLPATADSLTVLADERQQHWPPTQRFVWLIDQFEELFALGFEKSVIDAVGRFLVRLQREGVWTLACIRADAVPQLKLHPTLREVFGSNEGQYYLETVSGTALDDVIGRPAHAAGLAFGLTPSGQRLDQVLRKELYATRENTLPLLQFTLQELYRQRSGSELRYETYQQLGGLSGSVATAAEAALQADLARSEQTLPRIFRSLVSVDDEGRPSKRNAPIAEIAAGSAQRRLLDRLVVARLCVTDQQDGASVVAFAHEALLRTWPRLKDWLIEEGALLQARDMMVAEARRWEQHGKRGDWLVTAPDRIASIKAVFESEIPLPETARRFGEHSAIRAKRSTRIRRLVVLSIASLAVIAVIFGIYVQRARNATSRAIATQFENRGWNLLHTGSLGAALRYGLASTVIGGSSSQESAPLLTATLLQSARTRMLTGHTDQVRFAAFSPDGAHVITASDDHTARLWDTRNGRELAQLKHDNKVWQATFSRDGSRILTASGDNVARIFDAANGKELVRLVHGEKNTSSVLLAVFSPDSARVSTVSSDGTAWIWDVQSGRTVARLQDGIDLFELIKAVEAHLVMELREASGNQAVPAMTGIRTAAFSPDGREVVTASTSGSARVWDVATGKERLLLKHNDVVTQAEFSADGRRIVTASKDHTARLWDAVNGRELARFIHDASIAQATFSADGREVVTASDDGTARIWDATDGCELASARYQNQLRRDGFLPPDIQRMKTVIARVTNHTLDTSKNRELARLQLDGTVTGARFSADGTMVVTASDDHTARIWDSATGGELARLEQGAAVQSAAFSNNGQKVVTTAQGDSPQLWDVASVLGTALHHEAGVQEAVFSQDGRYVLTASSDHTARVWQADSGRQIMQLHDTASLRTAVFDPDGRRAVTVAGDATVWDVASGRELAHFSHSIADVRQAVFSPNGEKVLTAGGTDYSARIWDVASGRELLRLAHDGVVNSATFSPDGLRALTASGDQTARIWDAVTGKELVRFHHDKAIRQASFSSNGERIVTASDDHTAKIWDALSGKELARLNHDARDGVVVRQGVFSPDGLLVVTASSDFTARVWEVATGREIARFRHDNPVVSAAFFPDGRHVLTASSDRTARIWDVASGRELLLLQRASLMRGAVISPDGRRALTTADDAARLWNVSALEVRSPELNQRNCAWLPSNQHRFANEEIESDALVRDIFLAGVGADRSVCEASRE
jgi:WD40 repeat protein